MPRSLLMPFAVTLALAAPAAAQGSSMAPADRDYLVKDAKGGAYELALAKLATERASRDDVKAYARKLVADHDTYNAALLALGKSKGLQLTTDMDMVDTAKFTALNALPNSLFDKAFLEQAVSVNADDVKDSETERSITTDGEIKAFLAKFAAMDADHEALAKSLSAAK